jgi:hypothetical protein
MVTTVVAPVVADVIPVEVTENCSDEYYYVDTTNGNDSNDGSFSYPWKTIDKVNGFNFIANDVVLFKKGESWRELLTVPIDSLGFGIYGSGNSPAIKGSEVSSSWTACPAIDFGDDFEDGTLDKWDKTESNGTIINSAEQAFEGTKSAKAVTAVNNGTAYIQKATTFDIGTGGNIWLTSRFYADTNFGNNNTVYIMSLMETGGAYNSIKVGITNTGKFYVYNGVTTDDATSIESYIPDIWQCYRLYVYVHDSNGIIRLFVDNDKVVEITGVDTLSGTNWRRFLVGIIQAANDTPTLYIDYCRANGTIYDPSFALGYYKTGIATQPNDAWWNETTRLIGVIDNDGDVQHGAFHLHEGTSRMGYDADNDICYIRAPADVDPVSGSVELGQRDNGIYLNNKSSCQIVGIKAMHANDFDNGGLRINGPGGAHTIIDCQSSYCADSGLMIQGGSTDNYIGGGTYNYNYRHGVQFYQSNSNQIYGATVGYVLAITLGAIYIRESDDCIVEYCDIPETIGFGIDANASNRPIIRYNTIDNTTTGIYIEGVCADYLIHNNTIMDALNSENTNDGGINIAPTVAGVTNGIIRDNIIDDCWNGIQLNNTHADDAIVYRNLIKNTKAGSTNGDIWIYIADDVHIYNNTLANGGGDGIKVSSFGVTACDNLLIKNNIVYNPTGYCLNVSAGTVSNGTGIVIDYNCYWKDGVDPDMWSWGGTVYKKSEFATYQTVSGQDTHSIVADPLFVDETDYLLDDGSPCINTGIDVGLPYQGTAPDMGYLEKE